MNSAESVLLSKTVILFLETIERQTNAACIVPKVGEIFDIPKTSGVDKHRFIWQ